MNAASRPDGADRADFVARFGGVFEHSPWIADDTWGAGLDMRRIDAQTLHRRMCAVFRAAPRDRQLAVLVAHPDLAGRLAVAGQLTAESAAEQAGAGLDRCSAAEFERLQELNASYREKFGFPFIMAVRGRTRAEIVAAFEARLGNDPADEFETALGQVERIALLRLEQMLG